MKVLIVVCAYCAFTLGVATISSFPSSYLFDFVASQNTGCAVRVESPVARTALGALGSAAGGVGVWGSVLARITQTAVPATNENFNRVCE